MGNTITLIDRALYSQHNRLINALGIYPVYRAKPSNVINTRFKKLNRLVNNMCSTVVKEPIEPDYTKAKDTINRILSSTNKGNASTSLVSWYVKSVPEVFGINTVENTNNRKVFFELVDELETYYALTQIKTRAQMVDRFEVDLYFTIKDMDVLGKVLA